MHKRKANNASMPFVFTWKQKYAHVEGDMEAGKNNAAELHGPLNLSRRISNMAKSFKNTNFNLHYSRWRQKLFTFHDEHWWVCQKNLLNSVYPPIFSKTRRLPFTINENVLDPIMKQTGTDKIKNRQQAWRMQNTFLRKVGSFCVVFYFTQIIIITITILSYNS